MSTDKPGDADEVRPPQVSMMFADAFAKVDQTTGAALDEVRRRAESARPKKSPSDRPPKPGRFFLLVRNCVNHGEMKAFTAKLEKTAKVIDSGLGVASDLSSGWLEVVSRAAGVPGFRQKLSEVGLNDRVEEVLEIEPGQGRLQAKQIRFAR